MADRMTLERARALAAQAEAKRLAQQAYNKRKRQEEKDQLAEALRVIADAERAARETGLPPSP